MPPPDTTADVAARLARVRLLALDVDGTLTDGGIFYDDAGREIKRFHIHDGLGMVLARFGNLQIAWITGRRSPIVERRAGELGVALLLQGVRDKAAALREIGQRAAVAANEIAFMGDDLNDLPALRTAGAAIAPANAVEEVRAIAHFVTPRSGGNGAVRDAITAILRARGVYDSALRDYEISLSDSTAANPTQ